MLQISIKSPKINLQFFVFLIFFCLLSTFIWNEYAKARLLNDAFEAHVQINGTNYGQVTELNELIELSKTSGTETNRQRLTLSRSFVTDRSLYGWAHQFFKNTQQQQNIEITLKSSSGVKVSHFTLLDCKPMAWTIQSKDPKYGGLTEKIEIAVKKIHLH